MDPERQDYADYGSRGRLPTPADLVGCVFIVLGSAVIVAGFIAAVVLTHGMHLAP
jgi:hypothetical protein